ncbi:Two pore potassium channel protein sup-9 [Acropora cervicornis]|uniref:Two pore potassium channel protein sup-9 n=1 Tax=Acropora cervicornis TaxID=6130 RepID=A0AAD9QVI1_ACRCE|nr:Two pore potassium channel protein sup-9 [Acropora cervicornis]
MRKGAKDIFILCALVASFLFIGAGIFQALERPTQERISDGENAKVALEKLRTNLSVNMSKVEFDSLVSKIQAQYKTMERRTSSSYNWSYSGALYFSASVVTTIALCTIGFGDMVPMKSQDLTSGIQTLEYVVRGIYITLGLCLMSSLICAAVSAVRMVDRWDVCRGNRCFCCRKKSCEFSEELGPRPDGLYSVSRGLDTIVFPSVIPFRRFASDEVTPLDNDPRWLY